VLTDTYTGIAPLGVGPFVIAQVVGALAAAALVGWLFRPDPAMAASVVVAAEPPADDTD
jgi:glycerol uptake facilitator-like aquaporin